MVVFLNLAYQQKGPKSWVKCSKSKAIVLQEQNMWRHTLLEKVSKLWRLSRETTSNFDRPQITASVWIPSSAARNRRSCDYNSVILKRTNVSAATASISSRFSFRTKTFLKQLARSEQSPHKIAKGDAPELTDLNSKNDCKLTKGQYGFNRKWNLYDG